MPTGKGFDSVVGVRKEAAWGTPLAVNKAIPFVSEDFDVEIDRTADEVLRGKAGANPDSDGNVRVPFNLPCKLTYQDVDLLIAVAMGAAGTPAANGGKYDNTYSLAEDCLYSFTAAVYKAVSVWEAAGCKIDKMSIKGSANKPIDITFSGAAKALDLASALNTLAVVGALATEDAAPKLMFSDLAFKIAPQATALSGVAETGINSFEFSLANNLKLDDHDSTSTSILEPVRNGLRAVGFQFTLPRYAADTFRGYMTAKTALHAELVWTLSGYVFRINIPRLTVNKAAAPTKGAGLHTVEVDCTCWTDPGSVSASFTTENEFEIKVTNGLAASPLV
ncbi:MAG: phage tail tube protein [Thermodesulfobacteriota bacterium]